MKTEIIKRVQSGFRAFFQDTPVPETKTDKLNTTEIGISNSMLFGASDFRKYDPDKLKITKGNQIYQQMLLDEQVKAALLFKQNAVTSRDYFFKIATDENKDPLPEQQEMADFFNAVLDNMNGSFTDVLKKILSALKNGYSICEKNYEPFEWNDKAYWGIRNIKLRPFETFNGGIISDKHGNVSEIKQQAASENIIIPLAKLIYYVYQPDVDEHYGQSDLRAAYRAFWSKDIAIKFWNIHLERHAGGFIWAKVDGQLTTDQQADLKKVIQNMTANTGIMLPDTVALEQFNPMSTDAYDKAISKHDRAIAKAVLVPNLLGVSEQGPHGSLAQAETQVEAFFWTLDEIGNGLAETLNNQLFRQLALWNFGTEIFPKFTFEPINEKQKVALLKTWAELASKGAVTKTDADENHIRTLLDFPEKPLDEIEEEPEDVEDELPDNEPFLASLSPHVQEFAIKEFAEKPWLKRVNFTELEKSFTSQQESYAQDMADVLAGATVSYEKQVVKLFGDRSGTNINPAELKNIMFPKKVETDLKKTMRVHLQGVIVIGTNRAKSELPKKKFGQVEFKLDATVKTERFLSSRSVKGSRDVAGSVDAVVLNVLQNSIKFDQTLTQTLDTMKRTDGIVNALPIVDAAGRAVNVPARLETIARTNITEATNLARDNFFKSDELKGFVQAFEYSAILDDRTTDICSQLNGKIMRDFGHYLAPNHFNCRSIIIPVTIVDDWDGKESKNPTVEPNKGFGIG